MNLVWPRVRGEPQVEARIRSRSEDFLVCEQLGFEPEGEGEHVFLHLQKRDLNSAELVQRVAVLSKVAARDIGISGLKDRNAVTSQWLSVGMAGRAEPDWQALQSDGKVQLLAHKRHRRKLRRGVHKANRFSLRLRGLKGDLADLETRLRRVRDAGVPNYFGPQRFGRGGSNLVQARRWMASRHSRLSRQKRGLLLSALRAELFNCLLAARVEARSWAQVRRGDVCLLRGTRSFFACEQVTADIEQRAAHGDLHVGLPLWGIGEWPPGSDGEHKWRERLAEQADVCEFLENAGLELAFRSARLLVDDFCWRFCDDGDLQLDFTLGAGAYATALLGELVRYKEDVGSGNSSD